MNLSLAPVAPSTAGYRVMPKQHPHFGKIPSATPSPTLAGTPQFALTAPLIGIIEKKEKINGNPKQDVVELLINVKDQGLVIQEGQSMGVIPPSLKKNWMRFYSIADITRNIHGNVEALTLWVKRYIRTDQEGNETSRGLASTYLSNLRPGEKLELYGPFGTQLQPKHPHDANLLLFASGTGIASFRALLTERYGKKQPAPGNTHLMFSIQSPQDSYYHQEFERLRKFNGFTFTPIFSQTEKQHLSDGIQQHGPALLNQLKDPKTYVYICGHNTVENGIYSAFRTVAEKSGEDWDALYRKMKQENRWQVETKPLFYEELQRDFPAYAPKVALNGYTPATDKRKPA